MPAKKDSKKLVNKQNILATYQSLTKKIKNMSEKIRQQEVLLHDLDVISAQNEIESQELRRKIDSERVKLGQQRKKLRQLQVQNGLYSEKEKPINKTNSFAISSITSNKRKANPSTVHLNLGLNK